MDGNISIAKPDGDSQHPSHIVRLAQDARPHATLGRRSGEVPFSPVSLHSGGTITVERHHDLLRRIRHTAENVTAPFDAILCESVFAKNAMSTVAGDTPFQAVLGRTPPSLAEFEPQSSILHDDGGLECIPARGVSRIREQALQAIIQETARQRLRRAAEANTRRTTESPQSV